MDQETRQILDQLNKNIGRIADAGAVATAANTPVPGMEGGVESKGITSQEQEESFVDPLRKTFERIAKASPRFAELGAMKALDNPYGFLRAKNADGSYKVSNNDLEAIIVAAKTVNDGNGSYKEKIANGATPYQEWAAKSGSPADAIHTGLHNQVEKGGFGGSNVLMKAALDSSGGGALIRTDLESILHEVFLRSFPGYEALPKVPSNGLVHTFVQQTSIGTAAIVSELGSLAATESTGTYQTQASTNIAVVASQRAIGLKAMYASQQSGMNFGLGGNRNTEVVNALRAIAKVVQGLIFQGNQNAGASAATANDEDGAYNANGFTGLRQQLKGGAYSITKAGGDSYLATLRKAVGQLINAGADLSSILMFLSVGAQSAIDSELEQFFTVPKGTEGTPHPTNFGSAGLRMLQDIIIRGKMVPSGAQGEGIGYYDFSAAATEDIYLLDPEGIKLPYLGSPTPVILELPTGYDNRLANTYIPFLMIGMALYAKDFNRKVRIPRQVV